MPEASETAKPDRRPEIGEIVLYRSLSGVDMPAIVTALVFQERLFIGCHLKLFPPPRVNGDLIDNQWGAPQADDSDNPASGSWRFREP